ncbi:phage protein NinX family protein [Pseudomonas sp. MYb541]|uniref:phage protein NinX family protein n=1 Tax=Pseudomonas sp. MYb541 TaxID=2745402 RepID=UPI0030B501CA
MNAKTEVRVADLTGKALDWAVAIASGAEEVKTTEHGISCIYQLPEGGCWTNLYTPSTDWSQGGLLIDMHRISFVTAGTGPEDQYGNEPIVALSSSLHYKACEGSTHLIAACRAIVATKLGETISVPAELA